MVFSHLTNTYFSDLNKNLLKKFKIETFLILFIYLLPFSFLQIKILPLAKLPYSYSFLIIYILIFLYNYKNIDFKINKQLFFLFLSANIWMIASCLFNNNDTLTPLLGTFLRLFIILFSTFLKIDIKNIFKHLVNSIPLYFVALLFSEKIFIFGDLVKLNSNVLASSLLSIILLLLAIRSQHNLRIPLTNIYIISFTTLAVLIITESRGVIVSISLAIISLTLFEFIKDLLSKFVIRKKLISILLAFVVCILFYLSSIFLINRSDTYILSRYYYLFNQNPIESSTFKGIASDKQRFYLLTYSIENIKAKPIFGYGSGNHNVLFKTIRELNYRTYNRSLHNTYLTIAYQYGLPTLFLIILFFRKAISNNYNFNDFSFQLLICFNAFYGLFNDNLAKNYFLLIMIILSIGYRSQKIVNKKF